MLSLEDLKRKLDSMETTRAKVKSRDDTLQAMVSDLERFESRSFSGGTKQMQIRCSSQLQQVPVKSLGESVSKIEKTSGSIAMPMFDGTNPSLWFSKVEKFFNIGRFADAAKLDLVFLSLEGVALKWFLREMSTLKFRDWADFEHRLLARFDPVKLCATEHLISKLESEANGSNMETDGVAQLTVSISPLEPSIKFSNASLDVRDDLSSVFFEHSQVVNALDVVEISEMSTSVKTTQCALQLFDKVLMRDRRRNQQLKQRKHLKAWRFKFKMKSSTRQLKDSCSLANVGSNGKRIFRGKMRKQQLILLWIQISKLEGKLVFNGESNGEAATRMGNETLMLHHSFPMCFWSGPRMKSDEGEVGYTKDVEFTPSLRREDTCIIQLEDAYKVCMCNYMVQGVLELIMKGDNLITCSKLGLTQKLKLTIVCLLYSYIGLDDSWTRKFSKDWWFKFKIIVIWFEVVSCVFSEGYVSGVSLACSATGGTTKSGAGHGQQAVYEQILIVTELSQPNLVIQQVMRNENIKFSKQEWFKYKYWFATREKLHMTGMDVTATISNRFFLLRQKQRKCKKTWMFKYKPETQQKEWTNKKQHIVQGASVFDTGGSAGNLQCRYYEWLGAYVLRDLRSRDCEEWSHFILAELLVHLAQSHYVLVVLSTCGEAGLFVRVQEPLDSMETTRAKVKSRDDTLQAMVSDLERFESRSFSGGTKQMQIRCSSQLQQVPVKSLGESVSKIEKTSGSIAMPMFDGTNPSLWFSKVEKFFNIGRFADAAKLDLVFLSLEGVALKWFLREMSTLKFRDWADFEHRLLARFDPVKLCATEHLISKLESEANGSNMETDGVAQLTVSISPLEPSIKFSNASLDVRDDLSSVFFEHSQVVNALDVVEISEMSTSVKTTQCALQLFDKVLMRDRRRNQQLKQRKHLKAWRFKFKMKSSTRQLKDSCSLANVGSNGKRIFRGKMRKQQLILLWIQISKLEGKLVFNGESNGEAATRMGNETLMLHHSFPMCFWSGPRMKSDEGEVGYTKDVEFTPSLRREDTCIIQLEDAYKVCMCNYMVQGVLELIMKGDNLITCSKLGLTQKLKLTIVCLLYSYIGLDDSWTRKFSKDWWFKFKIIVIWFEVVSCVFSEGYVSGVSLACSATGGTTKSGAGHGQQAVYEQILIVTELSQPNLVIQQVMRNENIKFSKQEWFKYKYWFATREKLHMTGMDVTATISNRFFLLRQKQRKCKKTWMFKYKPETQQKEWTNKKQHIVQGASVFDTGGSAGNLQCRYYEWLGAYVLRDLRSRDCEEWSHFILAELLVHLAQSHYVLVVLSTCGEAGLFVRVQEPVRDLPHQFFFFEACGQACLNGGSIDKVHQKYSRRKNKVITWQVTWRQSKGKPKPRVKPEGSLFCESL
ncbi:hypothetical protein ISN45_Aa08g016570 [Arabidopsis thaliana x Arabidopsis arenosa]|uniref:Retrotransposon gag domain-containing protein n=1 Tax=Arabidopsis thaliana x Arabidopsis arenosa TaxID=1240361 RepID=A0A8T1XQM0_9BRAS|nr:hypothetical protein ISN45_Aa08g016570 [Arabidopsis thaliana x Arabidopsis arenosa]